MKRVEHIGEVIAIEEDKAVVQLRPSEDCKPGFGCACCASVRPEARRLRVQREDLEEGDVVSVSVPAYLGYVSTLTAFGLPGLTFLIGALIGAAIEGNQEAHGMPIIVGGILGLFTGFGLAALVEHKFAASTAYQVRRVEEGEA